MNLNINAMIEIHEYNMSKKKIVDGTQMINDIKMQGYYLKFNQIEVFKTKSRQLFLKTYEHKKFIVLMLIFLGLYIWSNPICFAKNDSLYLFITIASNNNPEIRKKFYEYQAALQKITQVNSLPNPELSIGAFLTPMEFSTGKQIADIRFMQMFPWWGTLKAAKNEMTYNANARYEEFRQIKLIICYDVQQTWYQLYKIRKSIQLLETYYKQLESIESLALVNYQVGNTPNNSVSTTSPMIPSKSLSGMNMNKNTRGSTPSYVMQQTSIPMLNSLMSSSNMKIRLASIYQIEIEKNELIENIQLLYDKYQSIAAKFNALLNRPLHTEISFPDTLEADSLFVPLQNISDTLFIHNPMLNRWHYEDKMYQARKQMIIRMGYPMIGVGIDYSIFQTNPMSTSTMNGKDMIMPMLSITIPIYRNKYKSMQSETEWRQLANQQSYSTSINMLQTQYYEALEQFFSAQRKINLYKKQTNLVKHALNITMAEYIGKERELSEIIRTWQQLLNYQLNLTEAVADLNTAIARFYFILAKELDE